MFPLPADAVVPQDGHAKQDCELAAGARWLAQWAPRVTQWAPARSWAMACTATSPFYLQVLAQGAISCSPASRFSRHAVRVGRRPGALCGTLGRVTRARWTGKQRPTDTYRFASALPLRRAAMTLCWCTECELTSTDADGKVLYRGAWATSRAITAHNDHRGGPGRARPLENRK